MSFAVSFPFLRALDFFPSPSPYVVDPPFHYQSLVSVDPRVPALLGDHEVGKNNQHARTHRETPFQEEDEVGRDCFFKRVRVGPALRSTKRVVRV